MHKLDAIEKADLAICKAICNFEDLLVAFRELDWPLSVVECQRLIAQLKRELKQVRRLKSPHDSGR